MDKTLSKSINKVVCPCCGAEYTLGEVFFPEDILGKCEPIIKDKDGKIEERSIMNPPSFNQEWVCLKCNSVLDVNLKVNVTTKTNFNDFDEDYESTIYKNRIILETE